VSQAGVELPLTYLRGIGAAPDKDTSWRAEDTVERLLNYYRGCLVVERGLAAETIRAYARIARRFCGEIHQRRGELQNLRAAEVTAFVVAACERSSTAEAKKTVTALGSLLRYLHIVGVTECALAGALPKVAGYRRRLARELGAGEIAPLLSSCDRCRSAGRRDYAVLMLLCRLGFRAGEG
jgi:site-specific recombinase XerD